MLTTKLTTVLVNPNKVELVTDGYRVKMTLGNGLLGVHVQQHVAMVLLVAVDRR